MTSEVSAEYVFGLNPIVRADYDGSNFSDTYKFQKGINSTEVSRNQIGVKMTSDCQLEGLKSGDRLARRNEAAARQRTQIDINGNSNMTHILNQPAINIGNINGNVNINFNNGA